MKAVQFSKVVINRGITITAWRAPGSKTVNSTISWGDGTYSPVCSDKHTDLSPYEWIWVKYNFNKREYKTFKWVMMDDYTPYKNHSSNYERHAA